MGHRIFPVWVCIVLMCASENKPQGRTLTRVSGSCGAQARILLGTDASHPSVSLAATPSLILPKVVAFFQGSGHHKSSQDFGNHGGAGFLEGFGGKWGEQETRWYSRGIGAEAHRD